ncbi:MAG: NAD(P)-binding protein, partial [Amylibacter sp.]|nr:NAD(P)-binding protein [Amylibacter sp.]
MTRRTFTKSALTAAALVGTGAAAKAADVDVVVIGAGAAGLAATDALIRDGYTVQCIEAANRIGGRVFSDTSTFGVPMDYGAHWLHNRSLNPFVNIGRKLGLKLYKAPSNMRVMVKGRDATNADEIAFFNEVERINHAIA